MNIDELVRGARPEHGWARSNGGRRVLDNVITAARADSASGSTAWDRPAARRPALRWSLVGTGLVGAAAAVALVAPAIVASPDAPAEGPPPVGALPGTTGNPAGGTTTVTAHDILLAAATRAETAPAETGKYWRVKTLAVFGSVRVGADPHAYWIVRRSVEESWDAGTKNEPSWDGRREVGVRPRAAADEKAWRAAGSPTTWTIDADGGKDLVLSTRPGAGELNKDTRPPRYLEDVGQLSLEQVRQLPADQQALRAWVTSRIQQRMGFSPGSADGDRLIFSLLGRMLLDTPAEPKVRAAAFRILADLPGVRGLGTVRDESGRSGQGVEFANGTYTERLIIDTATHLILADKVSSGPKGSATPSKESSTLVLTAEWSDAAPQVPSVPQ